MRTPFKVAQNSGRQRPSTPSGNEAENPDRQRSDSFRKIQLNQIVKKPEDDGEFRKTIQKPLLPGKKNPYLHSNNNGGGNNTEEGN